MPYLSGPPKIQYCQDLFGDNAIDPTKWNPQLDPWGLGGVTSIVEGGGFATININKSGPVIAQLVSLGSFDIRESICTLQFTSWGPDALGMERSLILTSNIDAEADGIQIDGQHTGQGWPIILFRSLAVGGNVLHNLGANVPYWVRARETNGQTYLEDSPDGNAWTTRWQDATNKSFPRPNRTKILIQFSQDNGTGGSNYALSFNHLNT